MTAQTTEKPVQPGQTQLRATPPDARPLSCKVIQSAEQFEEVRTTWQRLAGNPTVDPDFCRLLASTRREILRPHVVAVQEGDQTIAILAGRIESTSVAFRIGYKRIYSVRARCLALPYGGVLGTDHEDVIQCLLDHVSGLLRAGEIDMVDFDNVRKDSYLLAVVQRRVPWACRGQFHSSHLHWRMALPASGEAIEKAMSKKHRYWVRRMRKSLQERFPNETEYVCMAKPTGVGALADEMERISRHTYQRGLGVGFVNDEEHRRRLELWAGRGLLRAYLLRVQGKPVAFCLGTRFGDNFYLSHTAFIPDMSDFEPGTLVFMYMLDCLCREKVAFLDFGLGDAFYKQRFGTEHWQETILCLFAPRAKGLLLNLTDTASRLVNHAGRSMLGKLGSLRKLKKKWRQKLAKNAAANGNDTDR